MKIRCIAVDDEPMALEKLKKYIGKISYLQLEAACSGADEAMTVLESKEIDAIFIDISMPDQNGMDFISSLENPPMVVFITAYAEYAVQSYKVRAVDYLLKPYSFEDFQRACSTLVERWSMNRTQEEAPRNEDGGYLYLKVDYRLVKVNVADIIYIEGMNEYLKLHVRNSDPILTHTTFRNISDSLPQNFMQVHRSYLVNLNHIREVERSSILMSNDARFPIGDSYKEAFNAYVSCHTISKSVKQ